MGVKWAGGGSCWQFEIVARIYRQVLTIPVITPFVVVLRRVSTIHVLRGKYTYLRDINPQSKAIGSTALQCKVICIHSAGLATIVSSLVRIFVVHVIWNPNLRKYHRMTAHINSAFIAEELELVTQTVANGRLANFERKGRGEVLAPENTNNIHIVESVPTGVSTADIRLKYLDQSLPMFCQKS